MGRPRSWTVDQLRAAIARACSWREVLRLLGLQVGGGARDSILRRTETLGIDVSHLPDITEAASDLPFADADVRREEHGDVLQWVERPRSDRGKCEFESHRPYLILATKGVA
jgi:hypothetical protein